MRGAASASDRTHSAIQILSQHGGSESLRRKRAGNDKKDEPDKLSGEHPPSRKEEKWREITLI